MRHELVKSIVENTNDIDRVGATVTGRKNYEYIKKQSEINYDPLYCVQDIHENILSQPTNSERIKQYEKKYGKPFLWPIVVADRDYIHYNHSEQKRLVQGWFDFYTRIFHDFQPDLFLTSAVDSMYTWIPFEITQTNHGKSITWKHTRIKNKGGLLENKYDDFENIYELYSRISRNPELRNKYNNSRTQAEKYLSNFRNNNISPSYTNNPSKGLYSYALSAFNYFYQYNFGYKQNDFHHNPTIDEITKVLRSKYRSWRIRNTNIFEMPEYNKKFVYYPLHLQPEASTMVLAPMYVHQRDLIRDISKSLPLDYKLYVKEHPSMVGDRKLSYYDEIKQIKNVSLIDPQVESTNLIAESELVTTITGTAGLEAAMLKTPVIVFGRPHYRILSTVYTGNSKDLSQLISNIINNHNHDEDELLRYLTAIFECSYEMPRWVENSERDRAIEKLGKAIKNKVPNYRE